MKIWLKITLNAVKLPKFEAINRKSWLPRMMVVKDLLQCFKADVILRMRRYYVVCNTGLYTVSADNSICVSPRYKLYSE